MALVVGHNVDHSGLIHLVRLASPEDGLDLVAVRRMEAVYSEPATAAMMLASAAPTKVPATLS